MSECSTQVAGAGEQAWAKQLAEHEGLVRWVVRQQWRGELSEADARHEGRLGLWRALQGYDPGRGTRFSSYAVPAITHAVWAGVAERRGAIRPGVILSCEALVDETDLGERLHQAEVRAALAALIRQLPPRWRQIVVAHHGLGQAPPQSFATLGRALGVSRQRVEQLHAVALRWLAHPAHSLALRRLVGRDRRADYQRALARERQAARRARGRR